MLKKPTIIKSSFLVAILTLSSRILGFARDMLMAFLFGASLGLDVFLVAFKLPNLMRALFADGSFAQAFVPILTELQHTKPKNEVREFIARSLGILLLVLVFITILAELAMPLLVGLLAPGFWLDALRFDLANQMMRITFPYFLLISLTAFFAAILNAEQRFLLAAFVPVVLNAVMIFAACFLTKWFHFPEMALAWGVFIAGICQLTLLLGALLKQGLLPRPRFVGGDQNVKRMMATLLPSLFGVSIVQLGLFINMMFASFLPKGSISWLYYSDRLTFFPLGIFGISLATVILPHLAQYYSEEAAQKFNATLDWALRCLLLISLPALLGLFLFAKPIVAVLFLHGVFTNYDAEMTIQSVMAFALGVPGFMAVKILTTAFYSRHEVRLPVKIAMIAIVLNIVLNGLLMIPLQHVGLALATSLATSFNAAVLFYFLCKLKIYRPLSGWKKLLAQLIFANTVIGFLLWYASHSGFLGNAKEVDYQSIRLFMSILVSVVLYVGLLWVSGMRFEHLKIDAVDDRIIA